MSGVKLKALLAGIGTLIVLIIIIVVLYLLGGADQSALERLRDISIVFVVLLSMIVVVLLAAITVALVFLVIQIKDTVIPMLEEATGTVKRVRGTTNFITEEAVKPIVTVAGTYSRIRGMTKVVVGKTKKPPKIDKA